RSRGYNLAIRQGWNEGWQGQLACPWFGKGGQAAHATHHPQSTADGALALRAALNSRREKANQWLTSTSLRTAISRLRCCRRPSRCWLIFGPRGAALAE